MNSMYKNKQLPELNISNRFKKKNLTICNDNFFVTNNNTNSSCLKLLYNKNENVLNQNQSTPSFQLNLKEKESQPNIPKIKSHILNDPTSFNFINERSSSSLCSQKVHKCFNLSRNNIGSIHTTRKKNQKNIISINRNTNNTISFFKRTKNRKSSVCLPTNNTLQLFINRSKLFRLTTKQTQRPIFNFNNIDNPNYYDELYLDLSSNEHRTKNQKSMIQNPNCVNKIQDKWDNSDYNRTLSNTTETEGKSVRIYNKGKQKNISDKNKSRKHEGSFLLRLSKISESSLLDLSSKSKINKTFIDSKTLNHASSKFIHNRQYKLKTIAIRKLQTFQNIRVKSISRNNSLSRLNDSSFLVLSDLDNKSFQENVLEKLHLFLTKIETNTKPKLNNLETLSNSFKKNILNNSFHHIITLYDQIKQNSPKEEELKCNLYENYKSFKKIFLNKNLSSVPMEYNKVLFFHLLFKKQDFVVKLINHLTINMIIPKYFYLDIYNLIFIQKIFESNEGFINNHNDGSNIENQLLNRAHTISFKPLDIPNIKENKCIHKLISLTHNSELEYRNIADYKYKIHMKYCNNFLFRDYSYYIIPCAKQLIFKIDYYHLSRHNSNNLKMKDFITRKVSLKNKGVKSFNKGIISLNKNNFKNLSRLEPERQNTNNNCLISKVNKFFFLRSKPIIQSQREKLFFTKTNETLQINDNYYLMIQKKDPTKEKHKSLKDRLTITQQAFFHLKDRNYIQFKTIFIKNKLSPDLKDKEGNSMLSLAVQSNSIHLVKYLLHAGANVNAQNLKGNTPLHFALSYHNYDIADLLISNGANEKLINNQGSTPWQCLDINFSII